jgi:serine/threonine protein kinase
MKDNPSMMMETIPPGTILRGRYRIERALGSGGFGHVYLAVDLQTSQPYAVKEYFVSGSGGQAQLQHEAQVLSHLHHANLPAFHEAFHERGRYFVVLSYIEGNDLTDLIRVARQRNEAIPLARILGWIVAICDAVSFMHRQMPPIIHRDIKPDNIRIKSDGTAMLVDLGNAKTAADGARTLFFIRHQGTPGYAPQEQYPGGTGTDERSDIFALGGTLYFALTTHEPPNVSTRTQAMQQGQPDLPSLQAQCAANPAAEAPSADAGRQFRSGSQRAAKPVQRNIRHLAQLNTLPPPLLDQLNRIIMRAMAMRPRDRYQTVEELRNDLQKVVGALPQSTAPSSQPARVLDPNSTQPDLPMLYETIQEAKAQQQAASQANATQAQSASVPVPTLNCPRCHTQVLPTATFCPVCGSTLNNTAEEKQSTRSGEPRNQPQGQSSVPPRTPIVRDASSVRDSSLESTVIIRPQELKQEQRSQEQRSQEQQERQRQARYQAPIQTSDTARNPAVTPPTTPAPVPIQMKPKLAPSAQKTPSSQMIQDPPVTPAALSNQLQRSQGTNFALRPGLLILLIIVAVIAVILVVILLVLLSSHGHAHAAQSVTRAMASIVPTLAQYV